LPVGNRNATSSSDDLGQFRIRGLPAGDYYVAALSGLFADQHDRVGFATTFYPGATIPINAQPVHVDLDQDAQNVTFPLTSTPTAMISGMVVDGTGQPVTGAQVLMVQTHSGDVRAAFLARSGRIGSDGSFTFQHVPWGTYLLQAMTQSSFGSLAISVDTPNVTGLQLNVSSGTKLQGRFILEGEAPPPPVGRARVAPMLVDFVSGPFIGRGLSPGRVNDDWTFETSGLFGVGVVRAVGLSAPWTLKNATLNGRDVTDTPLDFRKGDVNGLEITITSRSASLSGVVREGLSAISDYVIIVFAVDSTKWAYPSRFVMMTRPNQQGRFTVSGLVPETYLAIAVPAVDGAQWQDPVVLETLRPFATRVTLAEGEHKMQDLKLIRR